MIGLPGPVKEDFQKGRRCRASGGKKKCARKAENYLIERNEKEETGR
jgi:hypothetical protein